MSKTYKRIIAAVLIVVGTLLLLLMTEDFYVRMMIAAVLVTLATFIGKYKNRKAEMKELHQKLEAELDEEERALEDKSIGIEEDIDVSDDKDINEEITEEGHKKE
jgi:low affinity Fe/Cu permease